MNRVPIFPIIICLSGVLICTSCSPSYPAASEMRMPPSNAADAYRIKPGDVLKVEFVNHQEYTRGVTVRPDSMITLPHLGDIRAGGLSPEQLAREASASYRSILRYPKVTVELVNSPTQVVYVGGEVKTPGMYGVVPGKSALQSIFEAGGTTPEAANLRAYLLRDQGTVEPQFVTLDLQGDNKNFLMQPKDILIVPKSDIATANQFVDQYFNKLIPFSKTLGVSYFIGDSFN